MPQIEEQNVEVIKGDSAGAVSANAFFSFDSVWRRWCPEPTTTGEFDLSASDGVWNMLFSTYLTHHTFCTVAFTLFLRLCDCLLCHGSGEVFAPNCFPFPQLFDHGHSG